MNPPAQNPPVSCNSCGELVDAHLSNCPYGSQNKVPEDNEDEANMGMAKKLDVERRKLFSPVINNKHITLIFEDSVLNVGDLEGTYTYDLPRLRKVIVKSAPADSSGLEERWTKEEGELRRQVIEAVCFKPDIRGHMEQFENIEALITQKETEARLDELERLNFVEASGFLAGGNHVLRQQVVTKRIAELKTQQEMK